MPSAVALLNPLAVQGRAGALRAPVLAWLARHAPGVPLLSAATSTEARALLSILAPRTRVALIGGDGTLHAMLPALLKCGLHTGLVARGRRASVARSLHLDELDWRDGLLHALHAPTAPVDVGVIETDHTLVHFAGLVHIRAPQPMALWIDRQPAELDPMARRLRVCNALPLPSDHDPTPRLTPVRITDRMLHLLDDRTGPLWLHRLGGSVLAPARPLRRVRLECEQPMAIRIDGEPQTSSRQIHIELLPGALQMTGSHAMATVPPGELERG
jgi:hypothetical protein